MRFPVIFDNLIYDNFLDINFLYNFNNDHLLIWNLKAEEPKSVERIYIPVIIDHTILKKSTTYIITYREFTKNKCDQEKVSCNI